MNTEQKELWDSYDGKGFAAQYSQYSERARTDADEHDITLTISNDTVTLIGGKAITAASATSATSATQDASGNVITDTYATRTEVAAKVDKVVPVSSDNLAALDSNGQLTEVGLTVLNNSITAIGGKTLTAAQNVVVINYSQVGTTGYMYSDLNALINAGKSIVIKREYSSSGPYPTHRTAYYTFCERYEGSGGNLYLNFCATYDTNWNNDFNRGYVLDFLKIYSYNSNISHQYSGIPDPQNHTGHVLTATSGTSFGWAAIPSQLPASTSSDEDKVLAVDDQGNTVWTAFDSEVVGTRLLDEHDQPVLDEESTQGNPIYVYDASSTNELLTGFAGKGFGAIRTYADQDGNNIKATYATKSELDGVAAGLEDALDTLNDAMESVAHAGMYDLGTKTESDLNNGKLAIGCGNSNTELTLTTVNAVTILANPGVANFALLVNNSGNSNDVTVTVKDSTDTDTFLYSSAAGNQVKKNTICQITCVGRCWTLAEFEAPA